jgi:alpha-aminoadipate carrier protein LysW
LVKRRHFVGSVSCPECGAEFEVSGVEVGEIIVCPECGVELEVTGLGPITVALAPEEGEDWGE